LIADRSWREPSSNSKGERACLDGLRIGLFELMGMPLLADYLEDALSQFGLSCEEFEIGQL
jgi:hypothetical protein